MLRGALMYLVLYLLLRVVLRRELGETGATDILVVVLLADAAQNGMAGRYTSITDGVALVVAILGTSALLDMLSYRWRWFARLIKPRPVMLVRNGQVDRRALRRQLMTMDELWSHLRENGVDSLDAVEEVWMESDGRMSVIPGQSQE
ncbi:MAG TPA: YetF domain-containing protein [Natronosporangium sp.]|nr:YetF domain-containing protein [Natronosporangium sp.]